ncbi:MAG: lipopolysaccharide assembly protein LapA domain-containing protein [Acidimicrobiia bacterium]|jgi:uncharacterized integral membrane protein
MVRSDEQTRPNPRLVLGIVLGVLVFVFVVENTRETKIRFFIPQVTAPLWMGLIVAALLGALAGALIARHMAAPELRRLRGRRDDERPPSS